MRCVESVKRRLQKIQPVGTFLWCFLQSEGHAVQKKGHSRPTLPSTCFRYRNTRTSLWAPSERMLRIPKPVQHEYWFRTPSVPEGRGIATGFVATPDCYSHFRHKLHEKSIPAPLGGRKKEFTAHCGCEYLMWMFNTWIFKRLTISLCRRNISKTSQNQTKVGDKMWFEEILWIHINLSNTEKVF